MNTNIDQSSLPDEKSLQELANRLFRENELYSPLPVIGQYAPVNESLTEPRYSSFDSIPHGIPQPHFASFGIPASTGGAGISYGSFNPMNEIDLRNRHEMKTDKQNTDTNQLPKSVAGSGISPSAHHQGNEVDLADPQTSLPDPHFPEDSKVPSSVAGSGISPSVHYLERNNKMSDSGEEHLPADIKTILESILSFDSGPQLPFSPGQVHNEDYYFLKQPAEISGRSKDYASVKPAAKSGLVKPAFEVDIIKKDFPILQERVNGRQIIWLDNAATTQKPRQVIDRISHFYEHENSNVHRAAHELAARATDAYEGARDKVRSFLNARSANEIVFVRGTTEAINLVAKSYGDQFLHSGDEIILSHLEHHANIVPWQQLAQKKGLKIRVIPVDDDGQILLGEYQKLLGPRTKLVSFTHVSNALGTITPAGQMIEMAHNAGAKVLLDGAQSVSHMRVDLQSLDPDFFVFSGHKIFGPTGIGVVYGKEDLLNQMQPWQGGGNMIKDVTFERTQFQDAPGRFEAGTGNIADAVGLGAALDYVNKLGIDNISQYEHYLLLYATGLMQQVPGLKFIGTARDKASVLSFILQGYSNDEVGKALNEEGIAVRTGHHCAQPILRRFGVESSVRPSLAFYNTCADIDKMVSVLHRLKSK
ncbi:MAG TPA: family 2A encapsulin nanocompartment cargo protein cysteine desulfurase [Puia sp.]|nr:family 2A encapsulin nanocompartment cargo protein cysteine desulfurase [Puia sp.]